MKIAFVVAGNGYGHLKRVLNVTKYIFQHNRYCSVLIVGASHHLNILPHFDFDSLTGSCDCTFKNGLTELNLVANVPNDYTPQQYHQSLESTFNELQQFEPDQVVSDNLVGVLAEFPKSILMGSFLFSETLANRSMELNKICNYENGLLREHKPKMLGLADMVMPGVRTKTDFVGLPWFCTRTELLGDEKKTNTNTKSILVTGGGTRNSTEDLLRSASELQTIGTFQVFLDQNLYDLSKDRTASSFQIFDFSEDSFRLLDWIVCRPGIGILTEAVKYLIPICAICENDMEMQYNANRIQELGMGVFYNVNNFNLEEVLNQNTSAFIQNISSLKTGGAKEAAKIILDY